MNALIEFVMSVKPQLPLKRQPAMSNRPKRTGLLTGAVLLAISGTALASTVSLTLGPLPLPDIPIEVCVDSNCIESPALESASLAVSAVASGLTVPVIVPGSCPAAQIGTVLTISSLTPGNVTIGATLSGTLPTGQAFSQAIGPYTVVFGPSNSATVSFCAGP